MAFDGIVTKKIISELNTVIIDGKINKVHQPSKNEIVLGIYSNGKNFALNINIEANNCRINLTTNSKPNPLNAPNFCMLLRKYLLGAKIKEIKTIDLERVIFIKLECYNELNDLINRTLVVELMGKHSNIILLNENNVIIDSLRHIESLDDSYRSILPARIYSFPESNKHSLLKINNFNDFNNIINNYEDISNLISNNFTGISKIFINYIINKLNISNKKEDLEKLFDYIQDILNNIDNNNTSIIEIKNDSNKKDFVIDLINNSEPLSSNFFIDDFYHLKFKEEEFLNARNTLLKLILDTLKKYTKRLNNINSKLIECKNIDTIKLYGELITANLYKIPHNNVEAITLENYYDNNSLITIPLDKSISPANNAKKFFKKYNKLKNTLEIVTLQKEETNSDLEYLQSIVYELENATNLIDIEDIYNEIYENKLFKDKLKNSKDTKVKRKKEQSINKPIEYKIDNFTVYVGKNNKQNDLLTKYADKSDIWFHTKDIHGSHVILKTNNSNIHDNILQKCAEIAAYHSKAKNSSNVPVDYTFIKNVRKPSGAKLGMVIYTNNKTLYVNPKKYN